MTPSITKPDTNQRRAGGVFQASSRPMSPARNAATNPTIRSAVDTTKVMTATQKKVKEPTAGLYSPRLVRRFGSGRYSKGEKTREARSVRTDAMASGALT